MNHSYLYPSFVAYNYFYLSTIWYKSHLLSRHIKCSGVVLFLDFKKSKQNPYLRTTAVGRCVFKCCQISYSMEAHVSISVNDLIVLISSLNEDESCCLGVNFTAE